MFTGGGSSPFDVDFSSNKITAQAVETPPVWNGKIALNFAGGAGTSEEPFLISTGAELAFLAQEVNVANATYSAENVHYKLTADIVLNNVSNLANWENTAPANAWTPIGDKINQFLGTFDGDGYTVSGIYISSSVVNQGLFGFVGSRLINTSTVKNVGVINSYVKCKDYVGGVVGVNYGKVTNCYNTGDVTGTSNLGTVGGVIGMNNDNAVITNCYNTGKVKGSSNVGGVVGYNNTNAVVTNCYNTGAVSVTANLVGGVVGHNSDGAVTNCYNTGAVSGTTSMIGGVVGLNNSTVTNSYFLKTGSINNALNAVGTKTTTKTATCGTFAGLDGALTPESGTIIDSKTNLLDALNARVTTYNNTEPKPAIPAMEWFTVTGSYPKHKPTPITPATKFAGGEGTKAKPYLIGTPGELAYLSQLVNADNLIYNAANVHYKLTAHIELNDTAKWKEWGTTPPAKSWTPIGGNLGRAFNGVFDGAGYTVSGIYANESKHQGLFGIINKTATVMNVGVIDSYIKADNRGGGIVGWNFKGSVLNCYNSGAVSGNGEIGGIVGENQGTVVNCYSTGAVSGTAKVGGAVGWNNNGAVANCYFLKTDTINNTLEVVGVTSDPDKVTNCSPFNASQDFANDCLTTPDNTNKALTWFLKDAGLLNALNAGVTEYNKTPAPAVRASAWETLKNKYPTFVTSLPLPEIALSSTRNTYNGAAQEPTVTVGSLNPTTDYTLSWEYAVDGTNFVAGSGTPAFKNAGTYRVTAIGAEGDYKGSKATADYVITPIGVTLAWTEPADLVYDKSPKIPEAVVKSGLLADDNCAVKTKAVTVGKNNTDVGTFTFTATELDNPNYVINTNAVSGTYEITKKALKNIKVSKEANGNAEFNAITLISGTSGKNCEGLANGDEVTITFATSKAIIGVYTGDTGLGAITLGGASANNYSVAKTDVTATITGLPIPAFSVMAPSAYDKTPHIPTVEITGLTPTTHYTLKWSYAADNVNFIDVEGTPEFINAGIYLVTATGVAGSDYEGSTQTGDYSITPIVVTLTWQPEKTFSYTGSPIVPTVVAGGMLEGDECAVTAGVTPGMDGTNAKPTPITFTATALSNTNYTLPTLAVSGNYTILSAKNAWIKEPPLSVADIYVGGTVEPKAEAKFGEAIYKYYFAKENAEKEDDENFVYDAPTEIGTYWVKAYVMGDPNYGELRDTAPVKFSIKQKPSDDDSGSEPSISPEDIFWTGIVTDLKHKDEPVVEFNCKYPRMSRRVLVALQEVDKTLNINLNGEKISLTSKQVKPLTFDKTTYSVAELKALIDVKPEVTPTPTPTPTEKPTEPTDPTEPTAKKCWLCGACPMFLGICLWIWLAIAVAAVAVVVVFIVLKKKKKNDKK